MSRKTEKKKPKPEIAGDKYRNRTLQVPIEETPPE
jgi:hypothetical protein